MELSVPQRRALAQIAEAIVELGQGLRELARSEDGAPDRPVERLWARLGVDTQKFLYELAVDFGPEGGSFDLLQASERLGMSPDSARARVMAVGRSARALGGSAPQLWTSERDARTRRRRYVWNADAHEAIIRLVEG